MANGQFRAAVAAALYATVHGIVVLGDSAREAGWKSLPAPISGIFDAGLVCSLLIVLGFAIPRALQWNIAVSAAVLECIAWLNRQVNRLFEALRSFMIFAAEDFAVWLRGTSEERGQDRDGGSV